MWVASCVYTLGYAALFAYRRAERPEFLFGMPSWVVWGIVAPWFVVLGITVWYSLWVMKDEDLGPEGGLEPGPAGVERGDDPEGAGG